MMDIWTFHKKIGDDENALEDVIEEFSTELWETGSVTVARAGKYYEVSLLIKEVRV